MYPFSYFIIFYLIIQDTHLYFVMSACHSETISGITAPTVALYDAARPGITIGGPYSPENTDSRVRFFE